MSAQTDTTEPPTNLAMSVVRDATFWRRFSAAVHLDEEAQAELEKQPKLKHSYVDTPSLRVEPFEESRDVVQQEFQERTQPHPPPPPSGGPLQENPPPSFSRPLNAPLHPQPRSTFPLPNPASLPPPYSPSPSPPPSSPLPRPPARLRSQSSAYPLIPTPPRNPDRNSRVSNYSIPTSPPLASPPSESSLKDPSVSITEYPFPQTPDASSGDYPIPVHPSAHPALTSQARPRPQKPEKKEAHRPIYLRRNSSALTLGLSGRPRSRGFQFWTSISADPSNRESWLEEQRRKKSKRTCMCWGFWLVLMALVAGVVVTVLLLRSKGII